MKPATAALLRRRRPRFDAIGEAGPTIPGRFRETVSLAPLKDAQPRVDTPPGGESFMRRFLFGLTVLCALAGASDAEVVQADQTNYKSLIETLEPGDTLLLAAGDYPDLLTIRDLHGTADAWIVIKGPDSGPQPRFLGDPGVCCNTIEIRSGSYFALENMTIDGQDIDGIFAISAAGSGIHHVRVEGCTIVGHGAHQNTVGISTKTTTWGWIIRRNTIVGAGTGMYLGNSDGSVPFIGGVIEYNLFEDSKGYNVQIKHQNERPDLPGIPTTPQTTVIRHNVFLKGSLVGEVGARPNLLVGTFPDTGNGSEDLYEIYGNLFLHNHREALLQASGRVSIHDNVFVDSEGNNALFLTDHNGPLKVAHVYNNTFYVAARAIQFNNAADDDHLVVGNAMFTDAGLGGNYSDEADNVWDFESNAGLHVARPSVVPEEMDFFPLAGKLQGTPLDLSGFAGQTDRDRDFNGESKGTATFRGAYAGEGSNPGWPLQVGIKEEMSLPDPDETPPTGTVAILGGVSETTTLLVGLVVSATDDGSGMGSGSMSFSNDGADWSPPAPYAASRAGWDLSTFGGSSDPGTKTVSARFRDAAGNWSTNPITTSIDYAPDAPDAGEPDNPGPGGGGCSAISTPGGGSPGNFFALLLASIPFFVYQRRRLIERAAGPSART